MFYIFSKLNKVLLILKNQGNFEMFICPKDHFSNKKCITCMCV